LSRHQRIAVALALSSLATIAVACGSDPPPPAPAHNPAPKPAAAPQPAAAGALAAADGGLPDGLPPLPMKEFQEADFAETDRSRDPFRSFEQIFMAQAKAEKKLQHQVLIDRYSLDELKLVGIITRGPARALLVDPSGLGWVGKVGDFVGKAELVHSGGPTGADVAINWRIDRIRESDVVLVREDPSHPEIPPTTRVIALYPDGDANKPTANR
jgi:type IV pilus assembly protein PilP